MQYNLIRPLFDGTMTRAQVEGCAAILTATADLPRAYRAYLLATTLHETARTMQPIHERGARDYFDKYELGTKIGAALGNTQPGDGYIYRGRGYVQITGRANYRRASEKLGMNLLSTPDLALRPSVAARILTLGCREGWFTGKNLSDYLDGERPDYVNARRVVNGTDKARQIADYAAVFEAAL